jgi:hypothetical protein
MVELTALATITSDSSDFKRASDKSKGGEENLFLSLYSLTTGIFLTF